MSLFVASLNSGSNGNCYFVGTATEAVLVDVGISCRELEKRLKRLALSTTTIKAIFISHEHSDHIRGLAVTAQKWSVPVYATPGTIKGCYFLSPERDIRHLKAEMPVAIGSLVITPFQKAHDAREPVSFLVSHGDTHVGVFTDIGRACDRLHHYFSRCQAAFLEANYDVEMLDKGRYPYHLKQRIRGGQGHLSNLEALQVFNNHRSPALTHLFLAHLSKENNSPEVVEALFKRYAGEVEVIVASRYAESAVYEVTAGPGRPLFAGLPPAPSRPVQASLF